MLDSVPDSQMVQHLPEFLDPLFNILDDPCPEISTLCDNLLGEFLSHIIDKPEVRDERLLFVEERMLELPISGC